MSDKVAEKEQEKKREAIPMASFCTNRILRITFAGKNIKNNGGVFVVEYCPMADDRLCARIEATVRTLPVVLNKDSSPGFSAKIKIYNPPAELLEVINQHAGWAIGSKDLASYYSERCVVKVEAGYWKNNKRDYTVIFGSDNKGWLNTSAYYRKGVDNILELYCHNVDISGSEYQAMKTSLEVSREGAGFQKVTYDNFKKSARTNKAGETWAAFISNVIREYAELRAPKDPLGDLGQSLRYPTRPPVPVTDADRAGLTGKWFELRFIQEPKKNLEPGYVSVDNPTLRGLMNTTSPARAVTLNGSTFKEKMNQLASAFPGGFMWSEDLSFMNGVTRYYIWQVTGNTAELSAEAKKQQAIVMSPPDIIIYNFQNMLQVPSVDGAGCFTMKMLFNPKVVPGLGIMLKWDDGKVNGNQISDFTKGVMTTMQLGQYFPGLQGGDKQANIAALRANNGYLFDTTYRVGYVTHTLSTHTSSWSTEVKTLSLKAEPKKGGK